jgi:hypothetical protein
VESHGAHRYDLVVRILKAWQRSREVRGDRERDMYTDAPNETDDTLLVTWMDDGGGFYVTYSIRAVLHAAALDFLTADLELECSYLLAPGGTA